MFEFEEGLLPFCLWHVIKAGTGCNLGLRRTKVLVPYPPARRYWLSDISHTQLCTGSLTRMGRYDHVRKTGYEVDKLL